MHAHDKENFFCPRTISHAQFHMEVPYHLYPVLANAAKCDDETHDIYFQVKPLLLVRFPED